MRDTGRRLSIVHAAAPARFGGLESVLTTLAPAQAAAGDQVVAALILTPDDPPDHPVLATLSKAGVPVERIVIWGRDYATERREIRRVLRETGADVLHTHGSRVDVVDAPVARRCGVATVTTVHGYTGGGFRNKLYEWLQTRACRRFDAVVAVSDVLASELSGQRIDPERVRTIPNAWSPTEPAMDKSVAREELGVPLGGLRVGWVGRLTQEKGPDVFIRAAAGVRRRDVDFSVIGAGKEVMECKRMACELQIGQRVTWHGEIPNASRLLPAFDVLVTTSRTEGTPMLVFEAMASLVPLVATRVGGVPRVLSVDDAILCESEDSVAIAGAIERVLNDPVAAAERATSAARTLETRYSVGEWVSAYRRVYQSVVA